MDDFIAEESKSAADDAVAAFMDSYGKLSLGDRCNVLECERAIGEHYAR